MPIYDTYSCLWFRATSTPRRVFKCLKPGVNRALNPKPTMSFKAKDHDLMLEAWAALGVYEPRGSIYTTNMESGPHKPL